MNVIVKRLIPDVRILVHTYYKAWPYQCQGLSLGLGWEMVAWLGFVCQGVVRVGVLFSVLGGPFTLPGGSLDQ